VIWGYEQLSEKPQIVTDPAEGEADDLIRVFCDPEAFRVVLKGKRLKVWRTWTCHGPKAMAFGEIIDAAHDQFVRSFQIFGAGWSINERHRGRLLECETAAFNRE
jgi:hypothetical protein